MRGPTAGKRLRTRGVELTDHAKAVIRHLPDFFDRLLEPREFAAQIVHGRLDPIADTLTGLGKEEVTRRCADERADHRTSHHHSRIVHTPSVSHDLV